MGVERVMGFCIFLVGSQIDERSGREFERDGWCGPGAGLERQQLDLRDDSEPARDAALYHLLLIPLQCVWEKVEYLQSWKHTTLILDHSPVHCVPLRLVFGKTRWISAKV